MGSLLDKALKVKKQLIDDSTPKEILEKLETSIQHTLKIGNKIRIPEALDVETAKKIDEAMEQIGESIGKSIGSFAETPIPLKVKKVEPIKKPTLKIGDKIKINPKILDIALEVGEAEIVKKEKKLMVSTPDPAKAFSKGKIKKGKKGRVFAFIGKHGTGKTYACCNFAERFKQTLYLDTEYKASEILDEQYPDLKYDMKEPILDKNKKHAQIFKKDSDVHIDVCQVINETTGQPDDIATVQYIKNNMPLYIQLIKSGKYKNLVIDSCTPIWRYSIKVWLKKNKRQRVTQFEYQEVEAIRQEIILPFVNYCRIYNVNLILTIGVAGHYINDKIIGYKEDTKEWLLGIFSYELWFEYDYLKYCLKHPYRPFWYINDENLDIGTYLFNKDFINDDVTYKEFEEFKYDSMTSESYRRETKKRGSSNLKIG